MTEQWGIGDVSKASSWGPAKLGNQEIELLYGEHPHSTQDNKVYARTKDGAIYDFDGHRILIDVVIRSYNYLKESEMSGDEIRKGGECCIFADGVQVYSFFHRDPQYALLKAHGLIPTLAEHPSGIMVARDRDRLVGRKVFYERTPAVITSLILDQGCVIMKPDGCTELPPPVWAEDGDDDDRDHVKDDILSPRIWWHRP